jgi:serine/threonine-protein kinase RsbT
MNGNKTVLRERPIPIARDTDIIEARSVTRALAARVGFTETDQILIASAVSELARNIVEYAGAGEVRLCVVQSGDRLGLEVVVHDNGPGIADLSLAMKEGYSTSGSLGLGLPGARRIMDEFNVESAPGRGTTVTMRKWIR